MRKANDGFTLIELVVSIICVTIVMGAAMTVLLMGQRTNKVLGDAVSEQQTARIITTMIEQLASEGSIYRVETEMPDNTNPKPVGQRNWSLLDANDCVIIKYNAAAEQIQNSSGDSLMNGVTSSKISLSDPDETITGRLIDFELVSETDNTYQFSVFCRTGTVSLRLVQAGDDYEVEDSTDSDSTVVTPSLDNAAASGRMKLLEVLCSQFGSSGYILNSDPVVYFSEWYIGGYTNHPGWSKDTPWCGCFLSWGVSQIGSVAQDGTVDSFYLNDIPGFADVDKGKEYFVNLGEDPEENYWIPQGTDGYTPIPGDFIFFDWDDGAEDTDGSILEHVGVVFACDNNSDGYVYTIEGNSGGKVALNRYKLNDPSIVGYGILDWKT